MQHLHFAFGLRERPVTGELSDLNDFFGSSVKRREFNKFLLVMIEREPFLRDDSV